jgi:hypothetical protein
MPSKLPLILAMIALLLPAAAAQSAVNDLFDRPNSSSLGLDWAVQNGSATITNNQLQGNTPWSTGWAMHTTFAATYDQQVIRARWSQNAIGSRMLLIAGCDASWSGVSVKIGDNIPSDMFADRVWFEAAVNAGSWFNQPTPVFFDLVPPLSSGTATVWFTNGGDTANVEIVGGGTVQTFSASGILGSPFAPTGTNVGVGFFNQVRIDDFQVWMGSPSTPAYTFTAARSNHPAAFLVTGATPLNNVALGFSVTGAGPYSTPLGTLGLDAPIEVPFFLGADTEGRAELPTGVLPASLAGFVIHTQAVDLFTPVLTNYFTISIL